MPSITRRGLLCGAAAGLASGAGGLDFPLVDYHVHLDEVVTLEKALELSRERGVRFGIVEHAGSPEFMYRGQLSSDSGMERFIAKLAAKPVYKGIQAEGVDWFKYFSKKTIAKLDYVLTDALTFPEKDGRLVRLWNAGVRVGDPQDFMDRYVDFHVRILTGQPIDIIANPTFLPAEIEGQYDALWTPARMKRIIAAAVKHRVAIEINSRYSLPRLPFLKMAKAAGAKFSFGSNIHGTDVGRLDYCIQMAKALRLTSKDMFHPAPAGRKPVETRVFT